MVTEVLNLSCGDGDGDGLSLSRYRPQWFRTSLCSA